MKAERERNSAVTLGSMTEEILQEAHDDQQNQCDNVNLAFEKRIEETGKAKKKLEDHLSKVSLTQALTVCCKHFKRSSLRKLDIQVKIFYQFFFFKQNLCLILRYCVKKLQQKEMVFITQRLRNTGDGDGAQHV